MPLKGINHEFCIFVNVPDHSAVTGTTANNPDVLSHLPSFASEARWGF
jgi:hypothetical protein